MAYCPGHVSGLLYRAAQQLDEADPELVEECREASRDLEDDYRNSPIDEEEDG